MPRILLIAATTGYQTRAFADAARRLGIQVTLGTDRCHVLEDPWNDRAVAIRFEDPRGSAAILANLEDRPDGIVAVADRSTEIAAHTAQHFNIPWHSPEAVALCRNKSRMRDAFQNAGLLTPGHFTVPVNANAAEVVRRVAFPCVLKPLGLSGSRGVIRADDEVSFAIAFQRVRCILNLPEILQAQNAADALIQIENYIPGKEFALEGIVSQGQLRVLALFDKPDPLEGPFFEETIYLTPSREAASVQQSIVETCREAVRALGLSDGPVHAEMRVNEAGVFMLEIAARPIGGLCARVLRFESDRLLTLEEVVILHAVGCMPENLRAAAPASGVMMIPSPGNGVLQSVHGVTDARSSPLITDVEITAKTGERLVTLPEGASYPGFIFAEGPCAADVEAALRHAHGLLRFQLLSALPTFRPEAT